MTKPVAQRRDVWSRYWASGALHSCGGSFEGNYAGPVADFWRLAFSGLPVAARVLDIGCGNGPLAQLLLAQRPDPGLVCEAVDLAQVRPDWAAESDRVRFHGGVAAESLPFADASFDLVISQFGLEYSDLERSLPEVQRVRAPGSSVHLVLHHAQALPVLLARAEMAHLEWALGPAGLLVAAADILEPLARAQSEAGRRSLASDSSARLAREAFNAAQDEIDVQLRDSCCPDVLHNLRDALGAVLDHAAAQGLMEARHALAALRCGLEDSLLRLRDLSLHALDDAAAQDLAAALRRPGEDIQLAPLADAGRLLGWALIVGPAR